MHASEELKQLAFNGEDVKVHWNFHKKLFSVSYNGRVVGYSDYVCISKPRFYVQPGGQKRARELGQRNVHAYVRGKLIGVDKSITDRWSDKDWDYLNNECLHITYNPFRDDTFVDQNENPVFMEDVMWAFAEEKIYVNTLGKV